MRRSLNRVVVIGAGIGGLSTAVVLARAGIQVTVLEAHVYPGGCAGTFYHQGYRFDAGATLAAGFYTDGPMDLLAKAAGVEDWRVRPADQAMRVTLPGGLEITRWTDERMWLEYEEKFGEKSLEFWRWQVRTADAMWNLALRMPAWPAQSFSQVGSLIGDGAGWIRDNFGDNLHPDLILGAVLPVATILRNQPGSLRLFIDGQLLIAAQTTSKSANALYGASALDLPRRGVAHVEGGIGELAKTLVNAVKNFGGEVLFRQEAKRITITKSGSMVVETKRGDSFESDIVVANMPPWNISRLLGESASQKLRELSVYPQKGWGAFTVYAGVDQNLISSDAPLHYQVISKEPLGEGNSVFISISPDWDLKRAPQGKRAVTISTHTDLMEWWKLYEQDLPAYDCKKNAYTQQILSVAETALPGLREAVSIVLPGTPITFHRFTRRVRGWVGGFPQTDLFQAWGPRVHPKIWMVGDSIFPGQSIAAVAMGGLRVAKSILQEAS